MSATEAAPWDNAPVDDATLRVAEHWAARGFPAFPVALSWNPAKDNGKGAIDKAPLTPRGHLDATVDPEELRRAFARARLKPGHALGVGIVPGRAGYVVLDCDVKDGKPGLLTLERLQATHGDFARYRYRTPSLGLNVVLRKPDGATFGNHQPDGWDGVDIRADSGWIVAPGTRSPWGEWVDEYGELDDVVELPAAMAAKLREAHVAQPSATVDEASTWLTDHAGPTTPAARQAFEDRLSALTVASNGSRHQALLGLVGWVAGMDQLDHAEALAEIREAWDAVTPGEGREGEPVDCLLWVIPQERAKRAAEAAELEELVAETVAYLHDVEAQKAALRAADPFDPIPESWRPVDLGPVLDGGHEPPSPAVLRTLDDAQAFFYRGNVNGLHGDPNSGKSWLTLAAIAQVLGDGRRAILLDYEANGAEIVARLRALAVTAEQIRGQLVYLHPTDPASPLVVAHILAMVTDDTDVVVIDSLGEAFGLDGIDENSDADVAPWLRMMARPIADAGPAVVLVDHATKAKENPLFPSGSKRKVAAITGSSFLVEAKPPPTRERPGTLRLTCAKDRHGNYRRGEMVATVDVTPYPDGGVTVNLHRAAAPAPGGPDAALEALARAVLRLVQQEGRAMSRSEITTRVQAKASTDAKRAAIDFLIGRGCLSEEAGARNARLHGFLMELPSALGMGEDDDPA